MYYNQSCARRDYTQADKAAKGEQYGSRQRPMLIRSMQRAAVNIYKTENSFEMLVFAPGRIKEHFKIDVEGNELRISYTPPEGFPRPDWIQREYSRGGFVRVFTLDGSINTDGISAKYVDGVLQLSLPFNEGTAAAKQEIKIN